MFGANPEHLGDPLFLRLSWSLPSAQAYSVSPNQWPATHALLEGSNLFVTVGNSGVQGPGNMASHMGILSECCHFTRDLALASLEPTNFFPLPS